MKCISYQEHINNTAHYCPYCGVSQTKPTERLDLRWGLQESDYEDMTQMNYGEYLQWLKDNNIPHVSGIVFTPEYANKAEYGSHETFFNDRYVFTVANRKAKIDLYIDYIVKCDNYTKRLHAAKKLKELL